MRKPFLLIAGDNYYPQYGTDDWIGCYPSYEEAESKITKIPLPLQTFERGPRKGQVKPDQIQHYDYEINGARYEWYDIVDLRKWTE